MRMERKMLREWSGRGCWVEVKGREVGCGGERANIRASFEKGEV